MTLGAYDREQNYYRANGCERLTPRQRRRRDKKLGHANAGSRRELGLVAPAPQREAYDAGYRPWLGKVRMPRVGIPGFGTLPWDSPDARPIDDLRAIGKAEPL